MSLIPDEMVGYGMFTTEMVETIDELQSRLPPLQGYPADQEFSTGTADEIAAMFQEWRVTRHCTNKAVAMTDENDVRQADRAEEQAVTKRISDVITDLTAGKIGRADRYNLGDALERANRNGDVQRAIR